MTINLTIPGGFDTIFAGVAVVALIMGIRWVRRLVF